MIKLFVGLGNPGKEYAGTRHNAGFEVIDGFAQKHAISVNQKKFGGLFGQAVILLLIQVGGLGIMTLSSMILTMLGQRVSLNRAS